MSLAKLIISYFRVPLMKKTGEMWNSFSEPDSCIVGIERTNLCACPNKTFAADWWNSRPRYTHVMSLSSTPQMVPFTKKHLFCCLHDLHVDMLWSVGRIRLWRLIILQKLDWTITFESELEKNVLCSCQRHFWMKMTVCARGCELDILVTIWARKQSFNIDESPSWIAGPCPVKPF